MVPGDLFHFSEEPGIALFEPRLIEARPEVAEPLVWAVDAVHAFTYCFPRDCPRILVWPLGGSTPEDRDRWFGASDARAIAHVEYAWLERIRSTRMYRYCLPGESFAPAGGQGGPGNYMSRVAVRPLGVEVIDDLLEPLRGADVELRVVNRLTPLRGLWATTLHTSGYRLRNAQGWPAPPNAPR